MLKKIVSALLDFLTSELLLKFLVALLVTIRLNIYVNQTRGYAAIGGEVLLVPLIVGVRYFLKELYYSKKIILTTLSLFLKKLIFIIFSSYIK